MCKTHQVSGLGRKDGDLLVLNVGKLDEGLFPLLSRYSEELM